MTVSIAPLAPSGVLMTRTRSALVAGALGAALVIAGALLPWMTVFAGLTTISGFQLDGGPLAALAVVLVAALAMMHRRGAPRWIRIAAAVGGAVVLADALYSAQRIAALVAHPGPAGALLQPGAGPGPFVTAAGGLLLLGAVLTLPSRRRPLGSRLGVRIALGLLLYSAGVIHLLLTPEHLAEAPLLGAGFLAAGIAQLVLAAVIVLRPTALMVSGAMVVNVALVALYVYAVLVGLPFGGGHEEHDAGLVLGAGEPVSVAGFIDLVAEVAAVALAIRLTRRLPLGSRGAVSGRWARAL